MGKEIRIEKEFLLDIDRDKVLSAMDCAKETSIYEKVNHLFDKLLPIIEKLNEPIGVWKFENKQEELKINLLNDSSVVVYSFISLGGKIGTKCEELFNQGHYLQALVLDIMANDLLFSMGEELCQKIFKEMRELGIYLGNKIIPGDEGIPFHYQGVLWERLELVKLGINLNDKFVFQPLKSMGFLYATTNYSKKSYKRHTCEKCGNLKCKMRGVED